jgi:uncharacterized oxidoreductase
MNLQNKTILITGAGTGMGLAAAKWFAEQGNKVIMVARNEKRLKAEASQIKNASYIASDLSKTEQLEILVERIKQDYPVLSHLPCKSARNQKPENYAANLQNDLNILVPWLSI